MRFTVLSLAAAVMMSVTGPAPAQADIVERACNLSDRRAATRSLCRCIDQVAQQRLTLADRKMVVRFFKDPDMAQKIRMSDRRSHEDFWERYVAFSQTASAICS